MSFEHSNPLIEGGDIMRQVKGLCSTCEYRHNVGPGFFTCHAPSHTLQVAGAVAHLTCSTWNPDPRQPDVVLLHAAQQAREQEPGDGTP